MSNKLQETYSLAEISKCSGLISSLLLLFSGLIAFASEQEINKRFADSLNNMVSYAVLAFVLAFSSLVWIFGDWREALLTFFGFGSIGCFVLMWSFIPMGIVNYAYRKGHSLDEARARLWFKKVAIGAFIVGSAFLVVQQFVEFFR